MAPASRERRAVDSHSFQFFASFAWLGLAMKRINESHISPNRVIETGKT
jgi:hypothetical protein